MPTPLEEVMLDSQDFESLAPYADRLAESEQRKVLEKERQDEIFEDATNAMSHKDLSKGDVKKLVKAAYEKSKTQDKLNEFDTLATAAEEIGTHMKKNQV